MMLETVIRKRVVENLLKRCILQCRSVDVSCNPIIVKDRSALNQAIRCVVLHREELAHNVIMVHIIRCTCDPRVLSPALPDQLQQIIHTR